MRFKPSHLNASLLVIIAEGFLSRLSFGIIGFVLPVYAYRQLGLSLAETGVIFSLNLIAEQALKPVMGLAADRFGLKRSFTTAIALRSLVALLFAFAVSPWQIYAIRVVHGISESLRDPSVNALIADASDRKAIASSFAWYSTAKTVAGSLGKAAGGILLTLTAFNYSGVFIVAFVLSVLPLYTVARYLREKPQDDGSRAESDLPGHATGPSATGPSLAATPAERAAILPVVVLAILINSTAHMLASLFPVLAMEYGGLSAAETGIVYTVSVAVVIVSGPVFGWLSDNVSRRLVLMVRGISNTFSSITFLLFPTFWGIVSGKAMDDIGKAAYRPAWGALMTHVSSFDRRRRALTMSYLGLGEGIGETIGPILGGFLWNGWGLSVMLGVRVALALASEVYAFFVMRTPEQAGDADSLEAPSVARRVD